MDGPFDFQEGGWDFKEKIGFPTGAKKMKCLQ